MSRASVVDPMGRASGEPLLHQHEEGKVTADEVVETGIGGHGPAEGAAAAGYGGRKPEQRQAEELELDPLEELDCTCQTAEWCDRYGTCEALKKLAEVEIPLLYQPRPGYPLLVLDMDKTLIDGTPLDPPMVLRPHTESFLIEMHKHYDLAIWSKTGPEWLGPKMDMLGMTAHPRFHFCIALHRDAMLKCDAQTKSRETGEPIVRSHLVKPLQLIWSRFLGQWHKGNTLLIDDKPISYALNRSNGILIRRWNRDDPGAREDKELVHLGKYLKSLVRFQREREAHGAGIDLTDVDHAGWREAVIG